MTPLRVGVIGAGRVGAVLAAALRSRGHDIVSVAGESDASMRRAAALLPGVPVAKPTASEYRVLSIGIFALIVGIGRRWTWRVAAAG